MNKIPYVKKGSQYRCVKCKMRMYKMLRDVYVGDNVGEDAAVSLNGVPRPKDGEDSQCPSCGKFQELKDLGDSRNWTIYKREQNTPFA